MAAKASLKRMGKKSELKQESVKSVWCAYFLRRAEIDRKKKAERPKKR
jgi:hypothetical protein